MVGEVGFREVRDSIAAESFDTAAAVQVRGPSPADGESGLSRRRFLGYLIAGPTVIASAQLFVGQAQGFRRARSATLADE